MAQTVHLWLTIDGNLIEGESSVVSLDREGTIECSSFRYGVMIPPARRSGRRAQRRQHELGRVHKRIDKSTPLLLKALCNHESVNEAEFRFYRPSPTGSGAEEHFFTVVLQNGYVSGVSQLSEDAIIAGDAAPPMMEEVAFVFQDITWTYEPNGATHHDSWRGE